MPFSNNRETEFVPQFNASIGRIQWKAVDPDYDYAQEVARSAYADMLHDSDRNHKYELAIQKAVDYRRQRYPTKPINVLDIGTGTGLLSMIAAKAGADTVTACEAFNPVAKCACKVLTDNGFADKVAVVQKRSTDMKIGCDMKERANLLVAELLDTELIGESALATYKHAANNLIAPDATLVPYAADLYLQVVESPFLWAHHKLKDTTLAKLIPFDRNSDDLRENISSCAGAPSVFDIQASELELVTDDDATLLDRQIRCILHEPLFVKRFNFAPPADQILLEQTIQLTHTRDGVRITSCRSGVAHAFIVWWRLKMEPSNTVPDISTAPRWTNDPEYAWRDHWMQAVYFPRHALPLARGQPLTILFGHDDLSLWFDFLPPNAVPGQIERPVCKCGLHYSWSRNRLAYINSSGYDYILNAVIRKLGSQIKSASSPIDLIVVSDCSLLPLAVFNQIGKFRVPFSIYHLDTSSYSNRFLKRVYAGLPKPTGTDFLIFQSLDEFLDHYKSISVNPQKSIFVLSEPYSDSALLPWDSLLFSYTTQALSSLNSDLKPMLLCPVRLRIWGVLLDFKDLWKIRAPVGFACEHFDLSAFDELVQSAITRADALVEPQSLWEYPGFARSTPSIVFEADFTSGATLPSVSITSASFQPQTDQVNGVAFWVEWLISCDQDGEEVWYSPTAPTSPIVVDNLVQWNASGPPQGVYIAPRETLVRDPHSHFPPVSIHTKFDNDTGGISFQITGI